MGRSTQPPHMAERSGVYALASALDVRTQAVRGFAVGVLAAAAVYYVFVVAPGGTANDSLYLLSLAGVLAFTAGLLATLAFTVAAAVRLARSLE